MAFSWTHAMPHDEDAISKNNDSPDACGTRAGIGRTFAAPRAIPIRRNPRREKFIQRILLQNKRGHFLSRLSGLCGVETYRIFTGFERRDRYSGHVLNSAVFVWLPKLWLGASQYLAVLDVLHGNVCTLIRVLVWI